MEFNVNSPVLFVIAGLIIAAVLAQSVYFLIKAWKRGLAIGMGKEKLRRIAHGGGVHHRPGGGDCHQRHHAGQGSGRAAAVAAPERGGQPFL